MPVRIKKEAYDQALQAAQKLVLDNKRLVKEQESASSS